jgi:two-component system sensor histidine kinase SaeS
VTSSARREPSETSRDLVIATVAHDLRSPLGAVYAVLDFVLDQLLPEDDAHVMVRRHLGIARNAANQMLDMVADLLEGTTLEAGRLALAMAPCDPADIVRTVADELAVVASRRHITVACDLASRLPAIVADRGRIGRIFSNLGANAIRFTPPGGCVTLSATADGNAVRFNVVDTGIGINEQDLPHVFERFWRADCRSSGGVGLGLAIAKRFVEAHRGEIWVESTPGQGSCFSFTIPLFPTGSAARPPIGPRSD